MIQTIRSLLSLTFMGWALKLDPRIVAEVSWRSFQAVDAEDGSISARLAEHRAMAAPNTTTH